MVGHKKDNTKGIVLIEKTIESQIKKTQLERYCGTFCHRFGGALLVGNNRATVVGCVK